MSRYFKYEYVYTNYDDPELKSRTQEIGMFFANGYDDLVELVFACHCKASQIEASGDIPSIFISCVARMDEVEISEAEYEIGKKFGDFYYSGNCDSGFVKRDIQFLIDKIKNELDN